MAGPVACGIHAVRVLLARAPQRVRRLRVTDGAGPRIAELVDVATRAGVEVVTTPAGQLDGLAGGVRHLCLSPGSRSSPLPS